MGRNIKNHAATAAVAAAVLLLTATPANAASPQGSAVTAASSYATCSTTRVKSVANNLPIRYWADIEAPVLTTAQYGYQYSCNPWEDQGGGVVLGGRYTACGGSGANGWIAIVWGPGQLGFTYMTCLRDV